jgi:hypothetical protein
MVAPSHRTSAECVGPGSIASKAAGIVTLAAVMGALTVADV